MNMMYVKIRLGKEIRNDPSQRFLFTHFAQADDVLTDNSAALK